MPQPELKANIEILENRVRNQPDDVSAWQKLGELYTHAGQINESKSALAHAIQIAPENIQSWNLLTRLISNVQDKSAAKNWLDDNIRKNPHLIAPKLALALSFIGEDESEALTRIEAINQQHPNDPRADSSLAAIYFQKGDYSEAVRLYQQALKRQPDSADILCNMAAALAASEQYEEAIEASSSALKITPAHIGALSNRADCYRLTARMELAVEDYLKAQKLMPSNPQILNKIGACMHHLDNLEAAQSYFDQAIKLAPDFALPKLNIGLLRVTQVNLREAKQLIQSALDDQLDDEARSSANITLAILSEHERIAPGLKSALQTKNIDQLAADIAKTPAILSKADENCIADLVKIADACSNLAIEKWSNPHNTEKENLCFIEAYYKSKLPNEPETASRIFDLLRSGKYSKSAFPTNRDLPWIYETCMERANTAMSDGFNNNGQAWIRYWHARLLKGFPKAYPGQLKPIANYISTASRVIPPDPEKVSATINKLCGTLRPHVSAGLPRALFMYCALIRIHGFSDGNSRLASFIMNWELENAAIIPVAIPGEYDTQAGQATQQAIRDLNVEPFYQLLLDSQEQTNNLLNQIVK